MKRILLILGLMSAANLAVGSEERAINVGGRYMVVPASFDSYVKKVAELEEVIKNLQGSNSDEPYFEDLSDRMVHSKGGWAWYLSDLLDQKRNKDRLKAGLKRNAIREHNRRLLNDFLMPIYEGLIVGGERNVVVVEYLLSNLVMSSSHATYSYKLLVNMDIETKKAKLKEVIGRYVATLKELDSPA